MTYTLTTFGIWLILATVVGALVGWSAHRGPNGAASDRGHSDEALEQLRLQVAHVEAQRDRLATELADAEMAGRPSVDQIATLEAERDHLQGVVDGHAKAVAELRVRVWNAESQVRDLQAVVDAHLGSAPPAAPDLVRGAEVLGRPVALDDLMMVLGLSATAADAISARGLSSWWALANADLDLLRGILAAAGAPAATLDPSTWPHQARLLALGQWDRYKTFVDTMRREGLIG